MPNPNGTNQFDRFAHTAKYGDVQKLQQATRLTPLSGATVSALNAPRRLQRHAAGQDVPRARRAPEATRAPDVVAQAGPVTVSPVVQPRTGRAEAVAAAWERAAAHPEASPLVREYAKEARAAVGRDS